MILFGDYQRVYDNLIVWYISWYDVTDSNNSSSEYGPLRLSLSSIKGYYKLLRVGYL